MFPVAHSHTAQPAGRRRRRPFGRANERGPNLLASSAVEPGGGARKSIRERPESGQKVDQVECVKFAPARELAAHSMGDDA